ncbi:MAG: F0F1 ATP synthase subunit epsilon [Bacteroidota bacterium]
MKLEILTPIGKSYSGDVVGVQLPGVTGSFEVLDSHAPLVAALKAGRLKVLLNKTNTESFQIEAGFVEVLDKKVTVMVEGSTRI